MLAAPWLTARAGHRAGPRRGLTSCCAGWRLSRADLAAALVRQPVQARGGGWQAEPIAGSPAAGIARPPGRDFRSGLLVPALRRRGPPGPGVAVSLRRYRITGGWLAAHRDPGGFAAWRPARTRRRGRPGTRPRAQVAILLMRQRRRRPRHHRRGLPGTARGRGPHPQPAGTGHRPVLLRAAAPGGRLPARTRPSTLRFVSRISGQLSVERARRPLRAGLPPRPRPHRGLPARAPAGARLQHPGARLANLGLQFWKNLEDITPASAPCTLPPRSPQRGSSASASRSPPPAAGRGHGRGHQRRKAWIGLLTTVRGLLPRHRPVGRRGPGPLGAMGRSLPGPPSRRSSRKNTARRKARMDQRTRERLPVLPALVGRRRAAQRRPAQAGGAALHPARRVVHRRRADPHQARPGRHAPTARVAPRSL